MSKIVVIWDAMLDEYIYGNTDRKNPESPMPLLNVEKEEIKLWWASNVAHNIASLDGWVNLICLIWDDENWKVFSDLCNKENINLLSLLMNSPTIAKKRFLDSQYKQQLLRVDYEKKEKISEENISKAEKILEEIRPDYILISDYNKWIITDRMMNMVKSFSEIVWCNILADIKPQNLDLFKWIFLIKPNFKEFCEMMGIQWIENNDENVSKYWIKFVKELWTNLVVTRGWKWSTLITKDLKVFHISSEERKVFDVTWAWDTYIATLTYALSKWYELTEAVKLANTASWIVVWKVWTASISKEELWIK